MALVLNLGKFLLNVVYIFHKLCPIQRRIVFVSRQSDVPSEDILLLSEELRRQNKDVDVRILCKMIPKDLVGKLIYIFHMLTVQMHMFATAEVVILDGYCIAASVLKHKKELSIVQMWHAMGALKKFGYCVLGEAEGSSPVIARILKMHQNYDRIFVSSDICKELLAPAYRCTPDKMIVMPLPRTDLLTEQKYLEQARREIYAEYPQLKGKETILYAPTFRKGRKGERYIQEMIQKVDYSKFNLVVELHPLMKELFESGEAIIDEKFSSIRMTSVADYIITDYSAFVFEAALTEKPLYRYVPDSELYAEQRGFLIDIDSEFPGVQSSNAADILAAIENKEYSLEKVRKFARKYVCSEGNCTKKMAEYILNLL